VIAGRNDKFVQQIVICRTNFGLSQFVARQMSLSYHDHIEPSPVQLIFIIMLFLALTNCYAMQTSHQKRVRCPLKKEHETFLNVIPL